MNEGSFNLTVSPVFVKNLQALNDPLFQIIVNQGGTRSGKTYSILQLIIYYCLINSKGKIIDIVRKTQSELWGTVVSDFKEIMESAGFWNDRHFNKTRMEYKFNGQVIRFIGMDKGQKKRGAKRNLLYINEANGITLDDWLQLLIRLEGKAICDFNPSEYFWINEHVFETRNDFTLIKSTYLDNYDFLTYEQIKNIESLILIDDYYYNVYVKGELATMKGKIYKNLNFISDEDYDAVDYDEIFYGLDFGHEHYTALIEIKYAQEQTYERAIYFERLKMDEDLIEFMDKVELSQSADIYADPAYPASIRRIREAGYSVRKAKKDVRDGIRFTQGIKRNICKSSTEYVKQLNKYKWKQDASGKIFNEPVKIDDDGPDASRYGIYSHLKRLVGA